MSAADVTLEPVEQPEAQPRPYDEAKAPEPPAPPEPADTEEEAKMTGVTTEDGKAVDVHALIDAAAEEEDAKAKAAAERQAKAEAKAADPPKAKVADKAKG